MQHTIHIPAEYMHKRRNWKTEKQHINEFLFCAGLPYRQTDMTDLHDGMKYVGKTPAPTVRYERDGSVTVEWFGVRGEERTIEHRPRPRKQISPWLEAFTW